jgi:hypothetical protein
MGALAIAGRQVGLAPTRQLVVKADGDGRTNANDVIGSKDAVVIDVKPEGLVQRNACRVRDAPPANREVGTVLAERVTRGKQFCTP